MIKLSRTISVLAISLILMAARMSGDHKKGYIAPLLTLSIEVKHLSVDCSYSKGKGFFGFYVEKGGHLYSISANSPLTIVDCDALLRKAKNILQNSDVVTISGRNRCDGYKTNTLDNHLLKKYDGNLYEIAAFSQVSNGKKCVCWFEGCKCLPVFSAAVGGGEAR